MTVHSHGVPRPNFHPKSVAPASEDTSLLGNTRAGHLELSSKRDISKRLLVVFWLNTFFTIVQLILAVFCHSLAIVSDTAHGVVDLFTYVVNLIANRASIKALENGKAVSTGSTEDYAALFSGLTIVLVSLFFINESVECIMHPTPVEGGLMLVLALLGLAVDVVCLVILNEHLFSDNLNLRSAIIHLASDLLRSIGIVIAACFVWFADYQAADPWASLIVGLLVLGTGLKLVYDVSKSLWKSRKGREPNFDFKVERGGDRAYVNNKVDVPAENYHTIDTETEDDRSVKSETV